MLVPGGSVLQQSLYVVMMPRCTDAVTGTEGYVYTVRSFAKRSPKRICASGKCSQASLQTCCPACVQQRFYVNPVVNVLSWSPGAYLPFA